MSDRPNLELPVANVDASPRLIAALNERLREIAGRLGWNLDAGGERVQNVGNPKSASDALNLRFADGRYARIGSLGAAAGTGEAAAVKVVQGIPGPPGPAGTPGDITVKKTSGLSYAGAVVRDIEEKFGEQVSVLDFGAVGNGSTNDAPAIQAAIDAVEARGGGVVLLPAGYTYRVNAAIDLKANVHLVGQGATSVIKRGAAIADGKGVIDVTGAGAGLANLKIDGDVTTTVALVFGTGAGETNYSAPMAVLLTKNTSVWLHGVGDFDMDGVTVAHTGGYSVILDARGANGERVRIVDCTFLNNRPHSFGLSAPNLNFGWITGGIFGVSDGSSFHTSQVTISGCTFARGSGNQVWTWLPAFSKLHSDWVVDGNTFVDIGRDCVLLGGMVNGVVSNNSARRIGYMPPVASDTGATTPRYLVNHWAVAFDTAGLARACSYTNNSVTSVYGGAFDLDGFSEGTVDGNTARTPVSGEPEYAEDAISTWTTTSYGINLGDTSANTGGDAVLVTNNYFRNMGAGAIRLYAWRRGLCTGNLIDHPASPAVAPISFGPGGAATAQECRDNVVTGNTILYPAGSAAPAIVEDATLAAMTGAVNHVYGNRILGANAYEFYKASSSSSVTDLRLSSASATMAAIDEMRLQVEGAGSSKSLKLYAVASAAAAQVMSVTKAGQANFSDNGGDGTGAVMLGNVSSVGFGSSFAGRHFIGDGFIAMSAGGFSSTNANALDDTWLLIRPNPTSEQWEQSVTTSAGARVWIPFGAGGGGSPTPPGANTELIFNDSGVFGADAGLTFAKATNVLTVAGSAGVAGVNLAAGWMQAAGGFLSLEAAADTFNAPSGGFTGLSHVATRNDGAAGFTLVRSSATARQWGMGVDSAGQWFLRDETASRNDLIFDTATGRATFAAQVVVGGAASGSGLLVQDGYIEATEGFYSPFTSYQTFQAPNGGMFARSHASTAYTKLGASFGAPTPTAGDAFSAGSMYWDTAASALRVHDGFGFVPVGGGGAVSSVTSVNANLTASPTTGAVQLGFSSSPSFFSLLTSSAISAGGVVTSSGGFNYTGFAANGIQAQTGGVVAQTFNVSNGFGGWVPTINSANEWVGNAVRANANRVVSNRFAYWNGSFEEVGLNFTIPLALPGGGTINLVFKGGILTAWF